MGEGKTDVTTEASPEILGHEVEVIRDNVTEIASELDRRRQELFDWRHQLRKHAAKTALIAAAALLLVGASIGIGRMKRRQKVRPMKKARQLRDALARVWAHPERIGRPPPSLGRRVLTAGLAGAVGTAAKSATRRLVENPLGVPVRQIHSRSVVSSVP